MTRLAEMERYLSPFLTERIKTKIAVIEQKKETSILNKFDEILRDAVKRQQQIEWTPVYLAVFHLTSSLLTKSYTHQICLMDEALYLDNRELEISWYPTFLYDGLEQEESLLVKELRKRFVRITDYEIQYMLLKTLQEYKKLLEVYIRGVCCELPQREPFMELKKARPFYVIYGDYMGETRPVLKY